jgi:hypothetical protein
MSTQRDALAVLAAADPARAHPGFDPRSALGQAVLERAFTAPVTALPDEPASILTMTRRRRRIAIAIAVGLAAAGAAAAAWVNARHPSRTLSVGCYAEARLDASTFVITAREGHAAEACLELWRTGQMGPSQSPRLMACVLESGHVGVFPGDKATCARLRLPAAAAAPPDAGQPGTTLPSDAVAAMAERLGAAAKAAHCLSPDDASKLAFATMDELHLPWSLRPGGAFTPDRPCVTWSFDEPGKQVVMVPSPPL